MKEPRSDRKRRCSTGWLGLLGRCTKKTSQRPPSRGFPRRLAHFEPLEDRRLLSVLGGANLDEINEPVEGSFDWGDAPDQLGYPTLAGNNGASHLINPELYLGNKVDADEDGQPDRAAMGDDRDNDGDDEDGVKIPPLLPGKVAVIEVTVSAPGHLVGWIDFDADGSWEQPDDRVIFEELEGGMSQWPIWVPASAEPGTRTFARFRFTSDSQLASYSGPARDGEVEDYEVFIESYDWGDAPDELGYPTSADNNGARHLIGSGAYLGEKVDFEADGQADIEALGDDNNGPVEGEEDDEDGVEFRGFVAGQETTITVTASTAGSLNAWIDFNADGDWDDQGETIFSAFPLAPGKSQPLPVEVPEGAALDKPIYARFRFSVDMGLLPVDGPASDGEVEDYKIVVQPPMDWGDAPDAPDWPGYPTLEANNGARHKIETGFHLGQRVDDEVDGQPGAWAMGDDNHGPVVGEEDDEDGVWFVSRLIPGLEATASVIVSIPEQSEARLDAWIDFNGDGSWDEPGDQIFQNRELLAGDPNILQFAVPATATAGVETFARFRLSHTGNLPYDGFGSQGEVEDYRVQIAQRDFGDAPQLAGYPTLWANEGANHAILPGLYLGYGVDGEPDGLSDPNALGDDLDGFDDEDGVRFDTLLSPGSVAQITVVASFPGGQAIDAFLQGWIDFDGDGSWAAPGEQIFLDEQLLPGRNVLTFDVPNWATTQPTFARFRFSSNSRLSFDGPASDGEVEDYEIQVIPAKWMQPPAWTSLGGGFLGWGEESVYFDGSQIVADDWYHQGDAPLTDIVWWGSFRNWTDTDTAATPLPEAFQITIWDNVSAGAERPWSHPGKVIFEDYIETNSNNFSFDWLQGGGWAYDPRSSGVPGAAVGGVEAAFRFEASLTAQPALTPDRVYWISISADYGDAAHPFGWNTRPAVFDDANQRTPQAAVRIFDPIDAISGDVFVDGEPIAWPSPVQPWDLAFELLSVEDETTVQWSQPPEPYTPPGAYDGWDELSVYGGGQIVADDWLCVTDQPVTDVHWWGSFLDWQQQDLPGEKPDAFHLGFWTDVPANPDDPVDPTTSSRPGRLIWESYAADYQWEFVGWDLNSSSGVSSPEANFYFEYDLPESEYFWQEAGENVYWISISAVYDDVDGAEVDYPFG